MLMWAAMRKGKNKGISLHKGQTLQQVSLNFCKALEAWNLIKKIAPKRPGVASPFVNEWPGYETSSYSNIDKNLLVVPCKA